MTIVEFLLLLICIVQLAGIDHQRRVKREYKALSAERDALRALCEGMEGKMRMIAEGKPENPCGDPWAFYNDLVALAREALAAFEKHKGVNNG